MSANSPDDPGIRFPPPLIFVGFLLAGAAVDVLAAVPFPPLPDGLRWGTVAAAAIASLVLVSSALRLFRAAGTRPEPWRPASSLATRGIYRRTRNPMYLGMALAHFAVAFGIESLAALLLLAPAVVIVDRLVIRREEAYLLRRFGGLYLDYQTRVRRWL